MGMTHLGLGLDGGLFCLLLFFIHLFLQLGQFGCLFRFLFELFFRLDRSSLGWGCCSGTVFHRIGHGYSVVTISYRGNLHLARVFFSDDLH